MNERFEQLAERLDAIGEEIAQAGIDVLADALAEDGEHDRAADKALASARRSVYKAAEKLRSIGGTQPDGFD